MSVRSVARIVRSDQCARARRGSAYLMVLMVSMAVALIGLSALAVERARARAFARTTDWVQARLLAQSAVERGLRQIIDAAAVDSDWRATIKDTTNGVGPIIELAGGTLQWKLQDLKGAALSTDPSKSTYVVGIGVRQRARHVLRVIVRPAGPAYSALTSAVHSDDNLQLDPGTLIQADEVISTNGSAVLTGSSVYADVEAVGQIQGFPVVGSTVPSASLRGMPDNHVFDYYLENGTLIDASVHLPRSGGDYLMEGIVLSPGQNPFGATNAEGIYVVDAAGDDIIIRDIRILGTLFVTGLGTNGLVTITGSINAAPASKSLPAILVDGDFYLALSSALLDEQLLGVNLNPLGTPYLGHDDDLADDVYPSLIQGLVYSKKDLTLGAGYTTVRGLVISEKMVLSESGGVLELSYDPGIAEDPPPGFFLPDGSVRIGAFTWEQVSE